MEDPAKELYSKIGRIWCPKLKDFVNFNRAGFQHLIRKHGIIRPKHERQHRFELLVYAADILKNPAVIVTYEMKNAELSSAKFWTFREKRSGTIVTVTVRQIGMGKKHFFSIYGKR